MFDYALSGRLVARAFKDYKAKPAGKGKKFDDFVLTADKFFLEMHKYASKQLRKITLKWWLSVIQHCLKCDAVFWHSALGTNAFYTDVGHQFFKVSMLAVEFEYGCLACYHAKEYPCLLFVYVMFSCLCQLICSLA